MMFTPAALTVKTVLDKFRVVANMSGTAVKLHF